jgi:hypothetical protein
MNISTNVVTTTVFLNGNVALLLLLQSVVNYDVSPPEGTCHWAVQLEDAESANLLAALPGG